MPRLRNEFPSTLVTTTMVVNMRVFRCEAVTGEVMVKGCRVGLISGTGCGGRLPLIGDVLFSLGAQRQVFERLFSQAPPFGPVEDGFANHAPHHARPEVI